MPTKIGLISDTHSTTAPLRHALQIFQQQAVDIIICAGDIAGYGSDELEQTVELLQNHQCMCIAGNHDISDDSNNNLEQNDNVKSFFENLPRKLELNIEGKSLYVIHASPLNAMHGGFKILDVDGIIINKQKRYWQGQLQEFDYDILVVGHTHQIFNEYINNTLVINPGSSTFNHNCSILTLPEMKVENFALLNKQPIAAWNWGLFHNKKT